MSETTPAAPAAEPIETTGATTPPVDSVTGNPPAPPADQHLETADEALDLLADDGEDDGGEPEGDAAPEASVKPIGPSEDATEEQIAEWRAEHGVPDDPTGYEAPAVEGVEWNTEALNPIHEIAHRHNVPKLAVADALVAYAKQVQAQHAAVKQRDAENAKAVRSALSADEIAAVKSAAKAMPAQLRQMLNQARGPDGTRVINNPEVLRMITAAYGAQPGNRTAHTTVPDARTSLQTELAEIDSVMYRDAGDLSRPWKNTGRSAADRKAEIMAEIGKHPPAGRHAEEERALLKLLQEDAPTFEYSPTWRGTGKTAAQRLYELRSGRA
jgi:hypothetical protein